MSADMNRFRGVSNEQGGPAKSNRFLVEIDGGPQLNPVQNDLTFLCEAAELPGRGFMSTDIRYYGPNFKVPYQSVYEDLNLTFICRSEFLERSFFDNWLNFINPVMDFNFRYRKEYNSTVKIHQFSELSDDPVYTFVFDEAYPILVSPQPATWADDNFHRLTVSFTYKRWYRTGFRYDNIGRTDGMTYQLLEEKLKALNLAG
jgi:hypothetical protein